MARGIIDRDFIFTAEIAYEKNFWRDFDTAIRHIYLAAEALSDISFTQKVAKNIESSVIKVSVSGKTNSKRIVLAADMLGSWKVGMFEEGKILEDKVRDTMEEILTNVAARFASTVIGSSGTLASALDANKVIVDSNKQRIIGAAINWRALDNATSRSAVKAAKRLKQEIKEYPYQTPNGIIGITGYWAFVDQGFKHYRAGPIRGRNFILDSKGQYHPNDKELLDSIPKFLTESVAELNQKTAAALKSK